MRWRNSGEGLTHQELAHSVGEDILAPLEEPRPLLRPTRVEEGAIIQVASVGLTVVHVFLSGYLGVYVARVISLAPQLLSEVGTYFSSSSQPVSAGFAQLSGWWVVLAAFVVVTIGQAVMGRVYRWAFTARLWPLLGVCGFVVGGLGGLAG